MSTAQINAVRQLQRAITACGKVGLMGGIYSGVVCVWPEGHDPYTGPGSFFEEVEKVGETFKPKMKMDGGCGV